MTRSTSTTGVDSRKSLVERVASSSYFNKSARLRELFLYLCERVLEESAEEIHEREVGHKVFGRPGQFWSRIFRPEKQADIVLDDAALGFFQELTNRHVTLSEYFDRSYLHNIDAGAAASRLSRDITGPLVLKRYSSYAGAALLWKLAQTTAALQSEAEVHFARDYSFREVKDGNAILLGNSRSNPWIEPFENRLGVRWKFDDALGGYYPVDLSLGPAEQERYRIALQGGVPTEGFAAISLLPNLNGTGHVLIISGTGGSSVSAAIDFLSDEQSVLQLRSPNPQSDARDFPYFETLLRINVHGNSPRGTFVVICRPPRA
jgi:hypothetical protein